MYVHILYIYHICCSLFSCCFELIHVYGKRVLHAHLLKKTGAAVELTIRIHVELYLLDSSLPGRRVMELIQDHVVVCFHLPKWVCLNLRYDVSKTQIVHQVLHANGHQFG